MARCPVALRVGVTASRVGRRLCRARCRRGAVHGAGIGVTVIARETRVRRVVPRRRHRRRLATTRAVEACVTRRDTMCRCAPTARRCRLRLSPFSVRVNAIDAASTAPRRTPACDVGRRTPAFARGGAEPRDDAADRQDAVVVLCVRRRERRGDEWGRAMGVGPALQRAPRRPRVGARDERSCSSARHCAAARRTRSARTTTGARLGTMAFVPAFLDAPGDRRRRVPRVRTAQGEPADAMGEAPAYPSDGGPRGRAPSSDEAL